jgi:hypothetical protein
MKKLALIISFILVGVLVTAETWTDIKQFQKYKFAKSVAIEADEAGNTFVAVTNYTEASKIALEFSKIEYSLYQMNSAAYCLINVYKQTKEQSLIKEAFNILSNYCQENLK